MVGYSWKPPRRRKGRWWLGRIISIALILILTVVAVGVVPRVYSGAQSREAAPVVVATQSAEDAPGVNPNPTWKVNVKERVSACNNRPGLKKIYVTVLDEKGNPLRGAIVRFETHPSEGIAYDHMNVWGYTDKNGYLEWDHLGIPTRYMLYMGSDEVPLIENIRTDLGNEYCKPPGGPLWAGNVPVNRPGIYSYWVEIQMKGEGE